MAFLRSTYGRFGRVALLVPRENPIAEPEISVLLAPDVLMMTTRMVSEAPTLMGRLRDYGANIQMWMHSFGGADFDAIAFACTGSSYLAAQETPMPLTWRSPSGRVVPFITSAWAVEAALDSLGCRRLGIASPYPSNVSAAAGRYWRRRGFLVEAVEAPEPPSEGHEIYGQSERALRSAIQRAGAGDVDAVAILGTGVPTLNLVRPGAAPVLSSALCMGWAIDQALTGGAAPLGDWLEGGATWRDRLRVRFPFAAS